MLNLTDLGKLPGAADQNLEALTRAIVSRRYSHLGPVRERRNQPGVEFYLPVGHPGELGDPGRVWGWSCKWFILGAGNKLAADHRKQIEDSFTKAVTHVDDLSDFVLCLPQRPTRKDLDWIISLGEAGGVTVSVWTAEDYDAKLAGLDELRSTFFGELVLSPDVLAHAHERSVAPVQARWRPLLHTAPEVEHRIGRALLRPAAFSALEQHTDAITASTGQLRDALASITGQDAQAAARAIADDLDQFTAGLRAITDAGHHLHPAEARERIASQQPPATSPQQLRTLVRGLRKQRLPAALAVTGLAASIRDAVRWLDDTHADTQAPLLAVVAAAGHGKTHLAAQLTAPAPDRPTAGVFTMGAHLPAGGTLDDLARRIPGIKATRFDDLLEALNSAGLRAGSRIPLIIDGLNEAERPAQWRTLLDELTPALARYPHVLVIVTLREALAASAVPDTATAIELIWRKPELYDLVRAYFSDYKINAAGAWLPAGLFTSPLLIRMYCQAANYDRRDPVGAEALPSSLIGVFEQYRQTITDRLASDPARVRIPADQIRRRLAALAGQLWGSRVRQLPSDEAKTILDAGPVNWDESLFRRLEEEGVIFRQETAGGDDTETGFVFDRLAGYLIADALLARMPYAEVDEQLADPTLWQSLTGPDSHPLGDDVAVSLAALVPRRFAGHHLWRLAPGQHRPWAIRQELASESEFLDEETAGELANLITSAPAEDTGPAGYWHPHPYDRLWEVRKSPAHRLNAAFLDRVLRRLPLGRRDRNWTEWARHRADDLLARDLQQAITGWTGTLDRTSSDDLDAQAIAWLLTSTRRDVRDLATKALQRYGRPEPRRLFDLAARMLTVDDSYIVERIVGAAFGAASAHQMPGPGGPFEQALAAWLTVLTGHFLTGGQTPTTHELLRDYIRTTFELAGTLHPGAVPAGTDPFALTFAATPPAPVMDGDDPNASECARTFGMDFENYKIGSLIPGRGNYDFDHPGFRRARGEVMARVWELGWRTALLGDTDQMIAGTAGRAGTARSPAERYGKKYGWIAYYELIGRLADAGGTGDWWWVGGGRHVSPDIDPTFPAEPPAAPLPLPQWAPAGPVDDQEWLRAGAVSVPEDLWSPDDLDGLTGRWLLAEGFLEHRRDGREVFGFFRTLLLDPADAAAARDLACGVDYPGNDFFPPLPVTRSVFAGETPWSPRFQVPAAGDDDPDTSWRSALRRAWQEDGIAVGQVAVELPAGESDSPAALARSYDVPSPAFADKFGLRQLPGTLDLVGLDGARASVIYRADGSWRGHLLFLRRDLVAGFAGDRRIMQVAWGERAVTVEWGAAPAWMRAVHQGYQHIWREIRVLDQL